LEHVYILGAVGTDELWPVGLYTRVHSRVPVHAGGTCTYFIFQNKYVDPHSSPNQLTNIDSIAKFELVCIGHDLSIPIGREV
jgi:hypothetical protein